MQLVEGIPLTHIPRPHPQILTYYYSERLARFSLVIVDIGKKRVPALVVRSKDMKHNRAFVRKALFSLKPVSSPIIHAPVIYPYQFTLAKWMAEYYWTSWGNILKKFIPSYLYATKKEVSYTLSSAPRGAQKLFLIPDRSFFEKDYFDALLKRTNPLNIVRLTSDLTIKNEFQRFCAIASGEALIIAGTRISVFAPFSNLKEIHIFEESSKHHASWDKRPKFNAVSVARKLSILTGARIIYHSLIPSVGLFYRDIPFLPLEEEKLSPTIEIINLALEKQKTPFSQRTLFLLRDIYLKGRQAILYINRRGGAHFVLCRDCGYVPLCPFCELSFTYHQNKGDPMLFCHHCGKKERVPILCPKCQSHEIRFYGFGTQRVEHELKKLFPKAHVSRLDSDIAPTQEEKIAIYDKFSRTGNFLVATSMALHTNLKPISAIIVLSADSELNIPQFNAYEELFLTLWQLRNNARKEYLIQTYNPSNPVFDYFIKSDWKSFYKEELKTRKALLYPPFSRIISLIFSHAKLEEAKKSAQTLHQAILERVSSLEANNMIKKGSIKVLGPVPSLRPKFQGKFRYQLLLKMIDKNLTTQKHLLEIVPVNCDVQVDPVELS